MPEFTSLSNFCTVLTSSLERSNDSGITIGIDRFRTFCRGLSSLILNSKPDNAHSGKTFAKFFGKGAKNILARSFAKILELRIITGGCVRQFHHIEEELPTKRQVNVFTESLNDWPSLADGSPAFL